MGKLKKVILVGDSIRMHYQEIVRRELAGQAEVAWPDENGEKSEKVLRHIEEWVFPQSPDIVQVNCGLHDLKKKFESAIPAVPIERYRENIHAILSKLIKQPGMTMIWAATTPVIQSWHRDYKGFDRLETDLVSFNQVAAEVATELGVVINDLYSVVMAAGPEHYLKPDGVHFNDAGNDLLGKAVADFLKPYL
jgi:lysophospholipase L1-like esterase